MWTTIVFGVIAALFFGTAVVALVHQHRARRLPALAALAPSRSVDASTGQVRCSVIVTARDDEARLEGAVRHLLAQEGVAMDVIVVNDRSTDRTADVLMRLASEDARVQARHVEVLPAGWLGDSYARHLGASAATAEWMLFADAHCWLKADVIARALQAAEREAADHVTVTPGFSAKTTGRPAWLLALLAKLAGRWLSVKRDRPRAQNDVGAFNLVRASVYRDCGGYEALRLTVVDEVKLGLLLRCAGARTRAFVAGDDVECHQEGTPQSAAHVERQI